MKPSTEDTIAAIATPPGTGGIGIVRLSGAGANNIAKRVCSDLPEPRRAGIRDFRDQQGRRIDQGLVIVFDGPDSYTGEDVVEFQGHGGMIVISELLATVIAAGARHAEPGEFTQRAYLNDRIDLAQAEAIADLIESGSAEAARAALRSLDGEFSARVNELLDGLVRLRTWVEAAMDFPEEEVDFLADKELRQQADYLVGQFDDLAAAAKQGVLLSDGMHLVIAGRPNAGKSSLLNQLAGYDAAIVTDIPGTTRDLLREKISIDGMPVHVVDTAGLRSEGDAVEQEGMRRALAELAKADHALLVVDHDKPIDNDPLLAELPDGLAVTVIRNKIDLRRTPPRVKKGGSFDEIHLSALSGDGVDLLRRHLRDAVEFRGESGSLSARRRHLDALSRAQGCVANAKRHLSDSKAGELMAEELREAQQCLGEITGEFTSDDLLGQIFSSFCIGK